MIRNNTFIELRGYLSIIKRRWPLIVIPALIVLGIAILRFRLPQESYKTGVRFIVGQPATASSADDAYQRRWEWVASEYLVNSVTDWANGSEFANLVRLELLKPENGGYEFEIKQLHDSTEALTIRSRLTILINHPDETELEAIARAVRSVLQDFEVGQIATLPQAGGVPPRIVPIDEIVTEVVPPNASAYIHWPLRIMVAVGVGLLFALIIEYLDPKIHEKRQLEAIDIPVVGSIPPHSA